jgi:hypothetical protein
LGGSEYSSQAFGVSRILNFPTSEKFQVLAHALLKCFDFLSPSVISTCLPDLVIGCSLLLNSLPSWFPWSHTSHQLVSGVLARVHVLGSPHSTDYTWGFLIPESVGPTTTLPKKSIDFFTRNYGK